MNKIKFQRPMFVRETRPKIQTLGRFNIQNALKPLKLKIHARKYIGAGQYEICFTITMRDGIRTLTDLAVVQCSFPGGKLHEEIMPEKFASETWRKQTRCFFGATKQSDNAMYKRI